ncbi:Fibroblast growth factor receptor substrate 2 [Chionoecetes opilio]|uniref:Fibroblast growth factor receptor substrate 2 n=1 Tax=Chionoecetes opilio TaxID=41210 RepID=A0A8J4Y576_CHIOP|nr:Fibroblast growth factor receptor substrate 2 [Chionoecetes opilio]
MGCVASKPDINDRHANIFQVVNVDEVGHRFSPAKLEVTESDLVLHQRGKAAIRWPLRCLRRYGFDAELFSFESGRRCPTGPGIYAFKCRRAEALFNMLQLQIQNITEDAASRDLGTALPILPPMPSLPPQGTLLSHEDSGPGAPELEGYLEPIPQPRSTHSRTPNNVGPPHGASNIVAGGTGNMDVAYGGHMYRSVVGMHSPVSPPTPLGHAPPPLYSTNYDGLVGAEDPPPTPVHDVRDPLSTCINHLDKPCPSWPLTQLNPERRPRAHPPSSYPSNQVYVNVMPENRHVYVNMMQKEVPGVPVVPPRQPTAPGSGSSHSGTTTTTTDTDHHAQINYIVLEMDHNSDSSVVPPTSPSGSGSPQGMGEGYTQIDFDKTRALNAARQVPGREDGSRKTRHNSTFSSATPTNLAHHNSSFSD